MTVAVAGASGVVGRAVVRALVPRDPEVRALVRRPAPVEDLRTLGAKVAVGRLDDAVWLELVFHDAESVVHLVGGMAEADEEAYRAAIRDPLRASLAAARRAGVQRFLFVSRPGASPNAPHPLLRVLGEAEELVAASGIPHATIRATHAYGVGGLWFTAFVQGALQRPAEVVGPGTQILAPVLADDLAAVLAAADDARDLPPGPWGAEGPDRVAADGLARLLAGDGDIRHLSPEEAAPRLSALLERPFPLPACALMAMDSVADAPDAFAAFGVPRTSLADGLRRTLERAGRGLGG
ncbi:MAG TPA: NAD(P)H-binding protein [Actinomycetota bacterium]|nr:NAD(P)H-binding protein [Actinomycetota bacterium]